MKTLNKKWPQLKSDIEDSTAQVLRGVRATRQVFGQHAGHKFKDGRWERSFNRALFEVQVFFFRRPAVRKVAREKRDAIVSAFKTLSLDSNFLSAIESTTKSIENTRTRFDSYRKMLQKAIHVTIAPPVIGTADGD
jgi:hypothetical protein